MKDRINSAQIVVPCKKFNRSLDFFTGELGFRVEMIFPADAPVVAVISGFGTTLRLEESNETAPLTLHLVGDFLAETRREIVSPDGLRVILMNADAPIEIPDAAQEFIVSTVEDETAWGEGRAGMLYRDLIPGRLSGRFVASHISIPVGGEVPDYVHFHKVRFQMIYCIAGWAKLVYENQGAPFLMNAGDCVLQPPEIRHQVLESSDKFEVLEIGCPAIHETFADHKLDLPGALIRTEKVYAGNQRFVHHIAANVVWKKSEFDKIEERDTKISEATDGLADVRVFRAIADASFSVRHSGEFMFFFVLKGNLRLSNSEGEIYQLEKSASFVLPNETDYIFDVEQGLEMIRVSLPALNE